MTDNEIIYILGKCVNKLGVFVHYRDDKGNCNEITIKDIIDVCKRKDEEIYRLNIELNAMRGAANSYKAEVDRLERHTEMYHELRAESVKEFAERLEKEFSQCQREYRTVLNSDGACAMIIARRVTDNLVKEMVGENQSEQKQNWKESMMRTFLGGR